MEFKDLIAARRSVRSYQSGACHKDLEAICKAAQQAPSWMNQQTARCYVLETPEVLETLRDAALPGFNKKSSANARHHLCQGHRRFRPGRPACG